MRGMAASEAGGVNVAVLWAGPGRAAPRREEVVGRECRLCLRIITSLRLESRRVAGRSRAGSWPER